MSKEDVTLNMFQCAYVCFNAITHLADDVHKVKKLTNDKLIDVAGMGVDVSNKVICDCSSSVLFCIFIIAFRKFRGI